MNNCIQIMVCNILKTHNESAHGLNLDSEQARINIAKKICEELTADLIVDLIDSLRPRTMVTVLAERHFEMPMSEEEIDKIVHKSYSVDTEYRLEHIFNELQTLSDWKKLREANKNG